jgi:hypothetical protein
MGSVPGKFETIVYMNAKKKGFGSNSERFIGEGLGPKVGSGGEGEGKVGPGTYLN